jgi:hypothetical protein
MTQFSAPRDAAAKFTSLLTVHILTTLQDMVVSIHGHTLSGEFTETQQCSDFPAPSVEYVELIPSCFLNPGSGIPT